MRCANPQDAGWIAATVTEFLEQGAYSHIPVHRATLLKQLQVAISSAQHFVWVTDDRKAVLIGVTEQYPWSKSHYARLAFVHSTNGMGGWLIRRFLAWARRRGMIKIIGVVLETPNERLERHLARCGLTPQGRVLLGVQHGVS